MVDSGSTTSNKSNTRSKSMKNLLDRSRMTLTRHMHWKQWLVQGNLED